MEIITKKLDKILNELQAQIKQRINNYNIDNVKLKKLTHNIFENLNPGLFIGIDLVGNFGGNIICDLTTSISLGAVGGGVAGAIIGVVIGGIILGIKYIFHDKKKEYIKMLIEAEEQYNSIYKGLQYNVNNKLEETEKLIENLIKFMTDFLNKEISLIQKEKWMNAKNEILYLSDKFELLFGNVEKIKKNEKNKKYLFILKLVLI